MTTNTKAFIPKGISAQDVAEYFLALANETGGTITNLKLQKLLYYTQAWHLANFNKPIFEEQFEAWVHGPVIPKMYELYKSFGYLPIVADVKLENVTQRFDEDTLEFLEEVAKVYLPHDGYALELMTHNEAPWIDARKGFEPDQKCNVVINERSMREFYGEKIKDSTN